MVRKADREAFMAALAAAHPNPKSELNYTTPFELLVAVVLSAQATDKGVNLATAKLFPVANTPDAIAALGVEGLTPFIQTIGLYRNKYMVSPLIATRAAIHIGLRRRATPA